MRTGRSLRAPRLRHKETANAFTNMANGNEFGNLTANIETDEERKKRLAAEAARQSSGGTSTAPANIVAPNPAMTQPSVTPKAPTDRTTLGNNTYGTPFATRPGVTPGGLPAGWTPATSIANLDAAKANGFTPKPTTRQTQLTEAEMKAGASVGAGTGPAGSASYTNPAGNVVNLAPSQVGDKSAIRAVSAFGGADRGSAFGAPAPIVPPMPAALTGNYAAQSPAPVAAPAPNASMLTSPVGSAAGRGFGIQPSPAPVAPSPIVAPRVMAYDAPGNPVKAPRVMAYDAPGSPVSAAPAPKPIVPPAGMEIDPATGKLRYKGGLSSTWDRVKPTAVKPFVPDRGRRQFTPLPYGVSPGRV